jgi:hypothetical protein
MLSKHGKAGFTSTVLAVPEGNLFITLEVERKGILANDASVRYSTVDGTTTIGEDYEAQSSKIIRYYRICFLLRDI